MIAYIIFNIAYYILNINTISILYLSYLYRTLLIGWYDINNIDNLVIAFSKNQI